MSSTVAVMGTCVGGDLVKYTKAVNGYRIVKNIVSINPISMYYNYLSRISRNDLDIYNYDIFCDSWYEKNIRSELNGTCFSELEMLKPDIVLVDLLDIRIDVVELSFENGCKIYYTKTQHSDLLKAKIIEAASHYFGCGLKLERVIKCMSWPDDKLKEFLNDYINILRKYVGNKLIIFKPKLANQYIDKNEIKFTENFHICGNINKFCDRLYNCISKGFSYIDAPKNIIGDASFLAPFEYHYCEPYYNYLE